MTRKIKDIYSSKVAWKMLFFIKNGVDRPTRLSNYMDRSLQLVSKYLRNLNDNDLVIKVSEGRKNIYRLTDSGYKLLKYAELIMFYQSEIDRMRNG